MWCTACNTNGMEQLACKASMKLAGVRRTCRVRKSCVPNGSGAGSGAPAGPSPRGEENTTRSSQAPSALRCTVLLKNAPR